MYKRIILIFIIVALIIGGSIYISYDAKKEDKVREDQKQQQKNSADSMYKYLSLELKDDNIIYSPLSIKSAFLMLKEGAKGDTKKELDNLFSFGTPKKYINTEKLSLANTLFINTNNKVSIKDSYIKKIKEKYNAEINYDDFLSPININNWVKDKTLGLIDSILDEVDQRMKIVIINALAIEIEWQKQFETTSTNGENFTLKDGTDYLATTMHNLYSKYASYYVGEDITAVSIDLKKESNANLEFIAIMPNDIEEYINNINNKEVNRVINKLKKATEKKQLRLSIPKFKFDYSLKLKDDLQQLGLNKVFTFESDLSGIGKGLYVSDALHKATIDFSEKGVKAAAVTAIVLKNSSALIQDEIVDVKINKPFVFIIRDKSTNEIWFIGTVLKPNSWEQDEPLYQQEYDIEF